MYAAIKKKVKGGYEVAIVSNEKGLKKITYTIRPKNKEPLRIYKSSTAKTDSEANRLFLAYCQEASELNNERFNQRTRPMAWFPTSTSLRSKT